MFAANTPENLARLAEFHEVRDAYFPENHIAGSLHEEFHNHDPKRPA